MRLFPVEQNLEFNMYIDEVIENLRITKLMSVPHDKHSSQIGHERHGRQFWKRSTSRCGSVRRTTLLDTSTSFAMWTDNIKSQLVAEVFKCFLWWQQVWQWFPFIIIFTIIIIYYCGVKENQFCMAQLICNKYTKADIWLYRTCCVHHAFYDILYSILY